MDEQRIMELLREDARDSVRFFSNSCKKERERSVVRAFLRCLGVHFEEGDLLVDQPEPIDVAALGGLFQVTEKLDEGRRRHDEYREELERREKAFSLKELVEPWHSPSPASWNYVIDHVRKRLKTKTPYPTVDALVYIDLKGLLLDIDSHNPGFSDLAKLGWRSVSMLFVPYSVVMYSGADAPNFIRKAEGTVRNEWKNPNALCKIDGLFEPGPGRT